MQKEWPSGKQTYLDWAKGSVDYYQQLVDEQGATWLLGLFMAKQWLRLLHDAPENLEDLRLLAETLEAERDNQGSEWVHMRVCVDHWIAEVEQQKNRS